MRILFIAITMVLLTGCISQPDNVYLIAPEDSWIMDCLKSPPPDKDSFMNQTDAGKLYLMTNAYIAQTKNIDECNIRLSNIRKWKVEETEKLKSK